MDRCPYCEYVLDDSDWFYNNDLFHEDDPKKVKCPRCYKDFMIQARETIRYDICKLEDYNEEYGEIW